MKALVLEKIKPMIDMPLKLKDVPEPTPKERQIRIKVEACGICRTDLHIIEGDIKAKKLPLIPGHQVVGRVDTLGEKSKRFKIGERVGVTWLAKTCGRCRFCRRGLENLCPAAEFTGYSVDGGYAEYLVVGEDYAHPIPKNFKDFEAAPLLCAGVIGYRSFKMAKVGMGDNLGLVGFGASAHLVIQVANFLGCKTFVFTKGKEHKKLAKKLDAAILFAPVGDFVPQILKNLERGGRLIINAIHLSPIPKIDYQDLWHEKEIKSVANVKRADTEEFLTLSAKIPLKTLVEEFPLASANQALYKLKNREIKRPGVLVL